MLVRITGELKNSVSNHIEHYLKPKDYKLEFGVECVDKTFKMPKEHPVLPRIIWGEHAHLQKLMPANWCETLRENYEGTMLRLDVHDGERSINLLVKLTGNKDENITVPPRTSSYHSFKTHADVCPEIRGYYDLKIREKDFHDKWHKIDRDIRSFLNSAKSLNAALKSWPGLRAFIPSTYIQRVEAKVERKASVQAMEEQLAQIDRETATAAATAAILAA